jgi:hypothetical protein
VLLFKFAASTDRRAQSTNKHLRTRPSSETSQSASTTRQPHSQSFSLTYGSILPTSLTYFVLSTRGCSPWRPDAVICTFVGSLSEDEFSRAVKRASDEPKRVHFSSRIGCSLVDPLPVPCASQQRKRFLAKAFYHVFISLVSPLNVPPLLEC